MSTDNLGTGVSPAQGPCGQGPCSEALHACYIRDPCFLPIKSAPVPIAAGVRVLTASCALVSARGQRQEPGTLCAVPGGRKHGEEVVLPIYCPVLPPWEIAAQAVPAGRGSARCPLPVLALRGQSSLFPGQTSGLLPRQGMAQPVLLCFLRRLLGRPAGFSKGISALLWWFCPHGGGGQPCWGRVLAQSRMLVLRVGHKGCGECRTSLSRLSGGRGRE